jgi:hypothetical protein
MRQAFDKPSATRKAERVSSSLWLTRRLGFELRARPRLDSLGPSPSFHPWRASATWHGFLSFLGPDADMEQSAWMLRRELSFGQGVLLRLGMRWGRLSLEPMAMPAMLPHTVYRSQGLAGLPKAALQPTQVEV